MSSCLPKHSQANNENSQWIEAVLDFEIHNEFLTHINYRSTSLNCQELYLLLAEQVGTPGQMTDYVRSHDTGQY